MTNLPADYALVLQQINDDGADDFDYLAQTLRVERGRLAHIIQALHHKGLIYSRNGWLSISGKGKRLMTALWPESQYGMA